MKTVHDFKVKNLQGEDVSLSEFKGKVLLIVNTASECSFTSQFGDLERLYGEYRDQGFEVLAFPSADFLNQEPRKGQDILNFCTENYGVSFPVFNKVNVRGDNASELFKYLSDKEQNGKVGGSPKWNFHKYLIDKDGKVVDYFYTFTNPTSGKLKKAVEVLLS